MPINLISPFNLNECKRRIVQNIDSSNPFENWLNSQPILGHISGNSIRLERRSRGRNSFAPIFVGTLIEQNEQTRIQGHFRMSLPVLAVLACIIGGLIFGFFFTWQPIIFCMLPPVLGLVGFGYILGKSDEEEMTRFFQTTLEAKKSS